MGHTESEREREKINKTDDGNIVLFLSGKCIKAGKQSVGKIRFGQKGGLDIFTACHSCRISHTQFIYIKKIVAIKFHHQTIVAFRDPRPTIFLIIQY